jgi:hypothetical protein
LRLTETGIALIPRYVSFRELLAAHFGPAFFLRYVAWRRRSRTPPAIFEGLDVRTLLRRELDENALDPELPADRCVTSGLTRLLDGCGRVSTVFFPFEYQPLERAVSCAAKRHGAATVGLQTGLFTANQMGFTFPAAQVRRGVDEAALAPVPDVLAAYGTLAFDVFAERLGPGRVCLSGPLRYPPATVTSAPHAFRQAQRLPADDTLVLVTTPSHRDESMELLDASFALAAKHARVFLLVKFHYHLLLHAEVRRAAERHGVPDRYVVVDLPLTLMLPHVTAMVCAGSSTGIEAIAAGCMPLVLAQIRGMSANPMLEVPEAAFFWKTPGELDEALRAVCARSREDEARRQAWPIATTRHLYRTDGRSNDRLYTFLRERVSFGPQVEAAERGVSSRHAASTELRV